MKISSLFFGLLFLSGGLFLALGAGGLVEKERDRRKRAGIEELLVKAGELNALAGTILILHGISFPGGKAGMAVTAWIAVSVFDIWRTARKRKLSRYRKARRKRKEDAPLLPFSPAWADKEEEREEK